MTATTTPLCDRYRGEFPILARKAYVNSCSQGALSSAVRAAYEEYLAGWDERGAEWEHWVERAEAARAGFARLIGAAPDEVAVTGSVSQAVSALVSGLRLEGGRDRIVISEFEFPAVGQIAHAQEFRGAEVVHVPPAADGTIPVERFAAVIDERTALVCCTAVCYRTGCLLEVAEVARIAHECGALVLADSYQGVGVVPLDVGALGVDFLTAGTVKYLLASAGLAFLYVRGGLLPGFTPTQTGWFADEDIFAMQIARYRPHPTARRFDAGTPPVPNIYAALAGMGIIEQAGVEAIAAHVAGLRERLLAGLDELGARVVTPRGAAGPLVCVESTDAHALVGALAGEDVVCSSRDRNVRLALHLYNTDEDVDAVLAALAKHRHLLA
jgi:selenocysteine lyase/cysteine desulfurase